MLFAFAINVRWLLRWVLHWILECWADFLLVFIFMLDSQLKRFPRIGTDDCRSISWSDISTTIRPNLRHLVDTRGASILPKRLKWSWFVNYWKRYLWLCCRVDFGLLQRCIFPHPYFLTFCRSCQGRCQESFHWKCGLFRNENRAILGTGSWNCSFLHHEVSRLAVEQESGCHPPLPLQDWKYTKIGTHNAKFGFICSIR